MMAKGAEQLRMNLFERRAVRAVERKGSHVITKGSTVYLSSKTRICWIASGTAYCDRLNKKRESAVRLKEPLRVYRDGKYQTIRIGRTIYVARQGLVKS